MQEPAPRPSYSSLVEFNDHRLVLPAQGVDLRSYWWIIRKRWRFVTFSVLGSLLFASLWTMAKRPLYTAKSTILIERARPQILNIRDLTDQSATIDEEGEEFSYYKTQFDILKSRRLAAQVIVDTGLASNPIFTGTPGKAVGPIGEFWAAFKSWSSRPFSSAPVQTDSNGHRVEPISGVGSTLIDS
jgi:uncharacterized protein involved in exopolysaccharide biosynthesis